MTIPTALIARADFAKAIADRDAAIASEWALGVQVAAQAQRLRLADELAVALRYYANREYHSRTAPDSAIQWRADTALAAWDAVPGNAK